MKALEVSDATFANLILQPGKIALVDFGAEWCPPCKTMSTVVDLIAEEFQHKAIVGTLDVDTNPITTASFGVRNLPTFLFFKDGKLVDRLVGAVPKSVLEQKIRGLYAAENL